MIAIADLIAPQLRPKYRVAVDKRVYQIDNTTLVISCPHKLVMLTTVITPLPACGEGLGVGLFGFNKQSSGHDMKQFRLPPLAIANFSKCANTV
ncbi:hypothetical protein [Nostoc sp. 'Peltigera membranacea cyanobiont' N6]|uniref:hypothetical protein n=1 Tax=Nostoc sp. 'Peltigera membranacea cyanobiont' N6 TaxID=1261031 RepID=UPI0011B0733D|nr:hypothetical protein [Nostoc sp. 'Peltigera membranacea cyanobiont' N6]